MGAAMTGMARHGGVLPVGGTFFVFSDYMRPSVRLAALSEAHVIYSWTHDSVGLGEDGPTHQPVEQLASLRAMPGLRVIRPADANETAHAWRIAVDSDGPTALVLSRQSIPVLEGTAEAAEGVARGGYVLVEPDGCPRDRPHRHRLGGLGVRGGRPPARRRRRRGRLVGAARAGPGGVAAVVGPLRPAARVVPPRGAPPRRPRASPSRRPRRSAGSATPTTSSPSTISARRPPAPRCSSTSGTRPTTWLPGPGRCWPAPVRHRRADTNSPPAAPRRRRRSRREGSTMTKLHDLYEQQGQSPWLDNLRRDYLRDGRLAELVDEGIRGVTSNPTIFAKAIESGNDYDEQFGDLLASHTVEEAYWELVVTDIRDALGGPGARARRLRRRRRLRVARRWPRAWPTTPTAPSRRPATSTSSSPSPTST